MDPFTKYILNRVVLQTALVLGIVIVGFALVDGQVVRWDLTEDNRFTISEASHRLAGELEDPLTIRAYFSAEVPPRYEPLQQQVFDILDEYEAHSGGRIKIERYDPDESKAAKDEADNYNIRPVQLPVFEATSMQVITVFGSIVLLYRDRSSEVIDIASRYQQGYEGLSVLEYEISSKIWQLSHERPKLGLTGWLSRQPPPRFPGAPPQGPARPEFQGLRRLLGEAFEISDVDLKNEEPDPDELPLLLVVRPKEFSDVELFRLDQYLVKGGRVLLFITQGTIEQSPYGSGKTVENLPFQGEFEYKEITTGLDAWLEHNGIRVPNEFVMHRVNANPIRVPRVLGQFVAESMEPNWFWPVISSEVEGSINQDNPAVQTLRMITLLWPHPVEILENKLGDSLKATVLVRSHEGESWRWKNRGRVDYRALHPETDLPDPSDMKPSPLAVAIEGRFESYFADRPVPPSLTEAAEEGEGEGEGEEPKEAKGPDVVKESTDVTQLVVIGNAFFVSDAVLGGQEADDRSRQATLLAFNLVDWLARSKELIALRAKRYTNRTLVEKDFKGAYDKIQEDFQASNKTDEDVRAAKAAYEEAKEARKVRRKRQRWGNSLGPCLLVMVVGAVVWVLRSTLRVGPTRIPAPVEPSSIARGKEE